MIDAWIGSTLLKSLYMYMGYWIEYYSGDYVLTSHWSMYYWHDRLRLTCKEELAGQPRQGASFEEKTDLGSTCLDY